jgi:hypothetical protein
MKTHKCPVADCKKIIAIDFFACFVHWSRLPRELRDQISRLYRTYTSTKSVRMKHAIGVKLRAAQTQALATLNRMVKA